MFPFDRPDSKLKRANDRALRELEDQSVASEEYGAILDRIVKLHEMQMNEKPASVSPDTLAVIAANLVGIVLILHYERLNVIRSNAMRFLPRPR